MEWKTLSKIDASCITKNWQEMDQNEFDDMVKNWDSNITRNLNDEYLWLRKNVLKVFNDTVKGIESDDAYKKKKDYYTDLLFGLDLYIILKGAGFSIRMASNDQVWIYLCVNVFPDIVNRRYPGQKVKTEDGVIEKRINEERFWKTRRRIYLKVIWWYVYLSMQKDENGNDDIKTTYEILKDNSTDEIVQIVERSGAAGYRVDVYRELMKFYAANRDKYDNKKFRQVMVLNTARTKIVEPQLINGGVETYIKELFEYE